MPELSVDLLGKGVIVTGAGGSIGSACALALAQCGASLALNDMNPQALEQIVSRVQALNVPVLPLLGDVSDSAQVQRMATRAVHELGNVFGLVNIAGTSMPKTILEMSQDDWAHTWNVNVTSLFHWAQAILPHMLAAAQGGRIVNTSSVSGKQGGDENSAAGRPMRRRKPGFWASPAAWHAKWRPGSR